MRNWKPEAVLVRLARISPESFAETIWMRNDSLEKKLLLLKPYIGKLELNIPKKIKEQITECSRFGCPHCKKCKDCLWSRVAICLDMEAPCFNIPFNGIRLKEIRNRSLIPIRIMYWIQSENIIISGRITRESWRRAMRFVKAHKVWAELNCWGADYKGE